MATLRILCLGDVVGKTGVTALCAHLGALKQACGADFALVNAENAARGGGLTREIAEALLLAGADVLTGGNHSFRRHEIYEYLDEAQRVLRPANYPAAAPGMGYCVLPCQGFRLLVLNVQGTAFLEPLQSPFECADAILLREQGKFDFAVADFHGEATAEKGAFARDFDGKLHVIVGTHTHVPTADLQILPGGAGFITDLGMCAAGLSVLGVRVEDSVRRFRTRLPVSYAEGEGKTLLQGALFCLDTEKKRVTKTEQILREL